MCRQDQNCFAVRDEGFTSGFVIAHEMGHTFGLNHDGQDNSCSGTKYKRTIMSPVVVSTFNHFWWSECSRRKLAVLMRSLHCLDNTPKSVDNHYRLTASQELEEDLGMAWSLDYQCRKDFGKEYEFCKAMHGDPCNELVCNKKSTPRDCFTRHGIPLPGTNCGENKKCFNATCVEDVGGEPGTEVDGTWGEWSDWTTCNANCGVGIKRRSRSCQFPANVRRGKECDGDANVWSTCVDYTCTNYKDKRAEECSKWEKTQGTTKWLPFEANNSSLKCKQTCKALPSGSNYVKQQNVADGTPCSYITDSSDICVDGQCIKVGCDGELNSSKKTTLCGTCDGNGSLCKTIVGDFIKDSPSVRRYSKVLRIPTGARHISVKKNSDAYTFLALKDGRTQAFFLNGNRKYVQFSRLIQNGVMFLYTHGNSTHLEMFIARGPLASPLDVMIYVGARVNNLAITYNFTVKKDDDTFEKSKFKWKFETWSECSVTCGTGTKQTVYACYDKDSNGKVDDDFCGVLKAPRIDTSRCSKPRCATSYSYRWQATDSWTDCNAKCDEPGTQTRIYQCQKMQGNRFVSDVEANLCNNVQKVDETRLCSGPLCPYQWEIGVWSDCSVTCGSGSQHRDVFCGDPANDEDDVRCTDDPPSSTKSCDMPECNGTATGGGGNTGGGTESSSGGGNEQGESCADKDASCPTWSGDGECRKNPSYMLENCKKSCKVCGDTTEKTGGNGREEDKEEPCEDKDGRCGSWSNGGQCRSNPGYMLKNCKKSCKVCGSEETGGGQEEKKKEPCVDKDKRCVRWAQGSQCRSNPGYMLKNCMKSCKVCVSAGGDDTTNENNSGGNERGDKKEEPCEDTTTRCVEWHKSGECKKNPGYMLKNCRKSCRVCTGTGEDSGNGGGNGKKKACPRDKKKCRYWKKKGLCTKNRKFMRRHCQRACGFCTP